MLSLGLRLPEVPVTEAVRFMASNVIAATTNAVVNNVVNMVRTSEGGKYTVLFLFGDVEDRDTKEIRKHLDVEILYDAPGMSDIRLNPADWFTKNFDVINALVDSGVAIERPIESSPAFAWSVEDLRKVNLRNKNLKLYVLHCNASALIEINKL